MIGEIPKKEESVKWTEDITMKLQLNYLNK